MTSLVVDAAPHTRAAAGRFPARGTSLIARVAIALLLFIGVAALGDQSASGLLLQQPEQHRQVDRGQLREDIRHRAEVVHCLRHAHRHATDPTTCQH